MSEVYLFLRKTTRLKGSYRNNQSCATFLILLGIYVSIFLPGYSFAAGDPVSNTFLVQQEMTLRKIEKALASLNSLEANFVQERHMTLFTDTLSAQGKIYFLAPDKLRWELTKPYVSLLILHKNDVAKFVSKDGKLRKLNTGMEDILNTVLKQIVSIMVGDFSTIRETYHIALSEQGATTLTLRPSSRGMQKIIKSIVLTLNKTNYHVTTIVINEPQGDSINIQFSDEKENLPLEEQLFNLNAPSFSIPVAP